MRGLPEAISGDLRPVLARYCDQIVAQMRLIVPVDQGDLRDSIGWTFGDAPDGALTVGRVKERKGAIFATIYAGGTEQTRREQRRDSGTRKSDRGRPGTFETNTAILQEFGTINMPANPFFFVVWRANRPRVKAGVTRSVRRTIKRGNF